MINNAFIKELARNRVLIDDNDCIDVKSITKLSGVLSLNLNYSNKKYGLLYVFVSGITDTIKIKYSNIELIDIACDGEYCIPINFVENECLVVDGKADKVVLKLYGNKFNCGRLEFLLPKNNMIVCGNKEKTLYEFGSSNNIIQLNYNEVNKFSNCLFVQSYQLDNVCGIGKLFLDNGLKFASSIDGFSSYINVSNDEASDAIFLQDASGKSLYFVYVKNNQVFYKSYNEVSKVMSGEEELVWGSGTLKYLVASSVFGLSGKFFGVVTTSGISVYIIKNDLLIEKVFDGVGDDCSLREYTNRLVVYLYKDNSAIRIQFDLDINSYGTNILTVINTKVFQNVINVLEYNNMYIYTSVCGCSGMLNIDE